MQRLQSIPMNALEENKFYSPHPDYDRFFRLFVKILRRLLANPLVSLFLPDENPLLNPNSLCKQRLLIFLRAMLLQPRFSIPFQYFHDAKQWRRKVPVQCATKSDTTIHSFLSC